MAIKMEIVLSDAVAREIAAMAARNGTTVTDVVRRSVGAEVWRSEVYARAGRVLVEDHAGDVRAVTFAY